MAHHSIETQWMGKMQFNSLINDHVVVMDAPERSSGEDHGPIPKPFILSALTGCAGMELMVALRKNGIEIKDLDISAMGELTKQVPYHYTSIVVTFSVGASKENQNVILESINLVMSEICGVSFMLQKIMPVTWKVNFRL